MTFIVATNVVASRLPERRPNGMPKDHIIFNAPLSWGEETFFTFYFCDFFLAGPLSVVAS